MSFDAPLMEIATLGQWRSDVTYFRKMELDNATTVTEDLDNPESEDSDDSASSSSSGSRLKTDRSTSEKTELMQRIKTKVNPELVRWVRSRTGDKTKAFLIVSFITLESLRSGFQEGALGGDINLFSIIVVTNVSSLLFGVWISLLLEGGGFFHQATRWHNTVRFFGISSLFTIASTLVLVSYRIGTPPIEVVTVGYIYMPISAALSYYVFRRKYGTLEWLSVGMMSLAVLAFVLLREECKQPSDITFSVKGFGMVVAAVVISVAASILAERAFKEQFAVSSRSASGKRKTQTKFWIMKVHLDFASMVISMLLWIARRILPHNFEDFFVQWSRSRDWFGTWGTPQFRLVMVGVAQSWAAGLVTKEFSTVIKAIVQTFAVVLTMCIQDKTLGDRFHYAARQVPSTLLIFVFVMAAVIFQTGRLHLQVVRKAMNISPEAHPRFGMEALPEPEDGPRNEQGETAKKKAEQELHRALTAGHEHNNNKHEAPKASQWQTCKKVCTTYALILVYIVSDAGRTIVLQKSLQATAINSTSMGLVCYICGAIVASGMSLYSHGFKDGLLRAWDPWKILHCLPAAFLFASATALGNMSFAWGINSALYVVLGKFYTPVAALGARWIMGKYYMWLEWFALLILTLASIVFGYLQAFDVLGKKNTPTDAPVTAMILVLASAAVSAFASLVTEKILKGEQDVPFHMQKVRLDVGSIISSLVLLPVVGMIATRAQDIPWAERPWDSASCPSSSVCWDLSAGGCSNDLCSCSCTSGVFAGWDSWMLVLAVFINTTQGWLVGKVTQQFSVIHRAIADSFSLLAIYFIGDPLFNGTSLNNMALNLVAFIVPVSTATFSVATSEMQKVLIAREKLRGIRSRPISEAGDPEDNSIASEADMISETSVLSLRGGELIHTTSSANLSVLSPASRGSAAMMVVSSAMSATHSAPSTSLPGFNRSGTEGHWMQ